MNAALLSAALCWLPPVPVEAPLPLEAVVARHGEKFVARKPHLAVIVGVSTPAGRRFWGFGGIDRAGGRVPPDRRTLYEIGSITKAITGTLLADLVTEGKLAVDDPVRRHLPDGWEMPTADGREISFLHLSTHTSSLPRLPPGMGPFWLLTGSGDDPYSKYRDENLRLTLSQVELKRPVGSRHEYSNFGVGLLGCALARADGEATIDSFFAKRILSPLGLSDTTFVPTEEQLSRLAPPFEADGDPAHSWHFDCLKACGGLRSTGDDMLALAEAVLGRTDTRLRPAFDLAMRPWREFGEGDRAIGLGWFVQPMTSPRDLPRKRGRLVWHNGATGGYRSFLGVLPEWNSAVVVLSNSTDSVDPALSWPVMTAVMREQR